MPAAGHERTPPDWDERIRDASARLTQARRDLEEARDALLKARRRYDRLRSALDRAVKHASQARSNEADVRRRAEEARRQAAEAGKWSQRKLDQPGQGQPEQSRFRLDAESIRLGNSLRTIEAEMDRRAAEVRRGETALRSTADNIRSLGSDVAALERRVLDLDQAVRRSARLRDLARLSGPTEKTRRQDTQNDSAAAAPAGTDPDPDSAPLTITDRAAVYLRSVLYGMRRRPGQILRFIPEADGGVTLALDTPRHGDEVVSVGDASVLLVQAPLPPDLQGTTVDVRGSAYGLELVIKPRGLPQG